MGRSHLVENVDFGQIIFASILECQNKTVNGVVDVDEGASLFSSSIDANWISTGDLGTETIQNCPEIAVNVNSVAQVLVHFCFWSAHSPNDALVEFSYFESKEFLEVQQSDIIQAFGHMVNTSRVISQDLQQLHTRKHPWFRCESNDTWGCTS